MRDDFCDGFATVCPRVPRARLLLPNGRSGCLQRSGGAGGQEGQAAAVGRLSRHVCADVRAQACGRLSRFARGRNRAPAHGRLSRFAHGGVQPYPCAGCRCGRAGIPATPVAGTDKAGSDKRAVAEWCGRAYRGGLHRLFARRFPRALHAG